MLRNYLITSIREILKNKTFSIIHIFGLSAGGIRRTSDDESQSNQYRVIGIDYDFVDSYGLTLIGGRNFSREFGTDQETVLFNEEALKLMNFESPESALGVMIYFWGQIIRS